MVSLLEPQLPIHWNPFESGSSRSISQPWAMSCGISEEALYHGGTGAESQKSRTHGQFKWRTTYFLGMKRDISPNQANDMSVCLKMGYTLQKRVSMEEMMITITSGMGTIFRTDPNVLTAYRFTTFRCIVSIAIHRQPQLGDSDVFPSTWSRYTVHTEYGCM